MKAPMGPPPPPPPQNPNSLSETLDQPNDSDPMNPPPPTIPNPSPEILEETMNSKPMGPPAFGNPIPPKPDQSDTQINESHREPDSDSIDANISEPVKIDPENSITPTEEPTLKPAKAKSVEIPFAIPPWIGPPCHQFYLEVLKDGSIVNQFDVYDKGAYMFGRVDRCDFILEHPTSSRFHAVLLFKSSGEAYLHDLGSTHGTFVNKKEVKKKAYVELHVGDVIRFGSSSRLYILQGPADLMPPESDLSIIRNAKRREDIQDRAASLQRARRQASLADGISWGMAEDAIEEDEDDIDEVTWQTYKGQLTEKQEKTREKVLKRTEKIAHMKKEIDAIRAKDIAQGGLTQGQQTQVARNEQRISQIMEELENLEETLNESIRESIGARAGKTFRGNTRGALEDEEELLSDDDEFYDRTKKKAPTQKAGENQSIETADTLLDKKDVIMKEMEDKRKSLQVEKDRMASETEIRTEDGDALDAFMSGLSSQLVLDKTAKVEKELSTLQSELDRIVYLLKIADPTGEAAKKRELKLQNPKPEKSETPISVVLKKPTVQPKKTQGSVKPENGSITKEEAKGAPLESSKKQEAEKNSTVENKSTVYTAVKPQWLGAIEDKEVEDSQQQETSLSMHESDEFVDYKDRKKMLGNVDNAQGTVDSEIESAAPGLIIRKRKQVEKSDDSDDKAPKYSSSLSGGPDIRAEDAVALLLKHERGYYASEDDERLEGEKMAGGNQPKTDSKKPKRVLGPERPSFLGSNSDYESWVPPEGQSGDGRTSLNEQYGY